MVPQKASLDRKVAAGSLWVHFQPTDLMKALLEHYKVASEGLNGFVSSEGRSSRLAKMFMVDVLR
jgi:hypothetical protein